MKILNISTIFLLLIINSINFTGLCFARYHLQSSPLKVKIEIEKDTFQIGEVIFLLITLKNESNYKFLVTTPVIESEDIICSLYKGSEFMRLRSESWLIPATELNPGQERVAISDVNAQYGEHTYLNHKYLVPGTYKLKVRIKYYPYSKERIVYHTSDIDIDFFVIESKEGNELIKTFLQLNKYDITSFEHSKLVYDAMEYFKNTNYFNLIRSYELSFKNKRHSLYKNNTDNIFCFIVDNKNNFWSLYMLDYAYEDYINSTNVELGIIKSYKMFLEAITNKYDGSRLGTYADKLFKSKRLLNN